MLGRLERLLPHPRIPPAQPEHRDPQHYAGAPIRSTRSTPYRKHPEPASSFRAPPPSIAANDRGRSSLDAPQSGISPGADAGHDPEGPRVLVIGLGALGTIFAWLLETRAEVTLTAVARSNYSRFLPEGEGVDIVSSAFGVQRGWKPRGRVVRSTAQASGYDYDYVICATKCTPDLITLVDIIAPALPAGEDQQAKPAILLLQSGLEIEEEVHDRLVVQEEVASAVLTASVWMGARVSQGGRCVEHGPLQRVDLGLYSTPPPAKRDKVAQQLRCLEALLTLAGIATNRVEDVHHLHWQKLLWNVAWGGLCCLARQPLAALLTDACINDTRRSAEALMRETLRVGRACGMDEALLPERYIEEAMAAMLQKAPGTTGGVSKSYRPALLCDWDAGKPNEFGAIFIPLRTRARAYDVPTPAIDVLIAAMRPTQHELVARAREQAVDKA